MNSTPHATIEKITDKRIIAKRFSQAAKQYDDVAVLEKEVGCRLLERLAHIEIDPLDIVDLGSGTGNLTKKLSLKYPCANIISIDLAQGMLDYAQNKLIGNNFLQPCEERKKLTLWMCADAEKLPLSNNSVDLIFSNCAIQWCLSLEDLFSELYRVLKPGGVLLFSSFGPDTLYELRECCEKLEQTNKLEKGKDAALENKDHHPQHVNFFIDMHHVGDLLLRKKFAQPVMDRETIQLVYKNFDRLRQDLKLSGSNYVFQPVTQQHTQPINKKLTVANLAAAYENFRTQKGELPATFELIYGYAFVNKKVVSTNKKISLTIKHKSNQCI